MAGVKSMRPRLSTAKKVGHELPESSSTLKKKKERKKEKP
jgi:hypothetical protein